MRLYTLFKRCLTIPYVHLHGGLDYAICRRGREAELYLEASDGGEDWRKNLDFPAVAYRRGGKPVFYAHRGFLKAHAALTPILDALIAEEGLTALTLVGYSHGAALALLSYEYVGYHRPGLPLFGVGFGAPRVLFGPCRREMKERLAGFTVVRNIDDIVTHLPPAALGYYHVGELVTVGARGRYSRVDAHRPENILCELARAGI